MEAQNTRNGFVLEENHLLALQEFIGSLNLPWKQTNAYMQILLSAKKVTLTEQPPPPQPPQPQLPQPQPMAAPPAPKARAARKTTKKSK